MKEEGGYQKCGYEDLDPFRNCKPVNCEEKYLGKRNFFKYPNCIPATICDEDGRYDYDTNTCENPKNIFSEDEINEMKSGKFTNWEHHDDRQDDLISNEVR